MSAALAKDEPSRHSSHHRTSTAVANVKVADFETWPVPVSKDFSPKGGTIASPSFSQAWSATFSSRFPDPKIRNQNRPRADKIDDEAARVTLTAGTYHAAGYRSETAFVTFQRPEQ